MAARRFVCQLTITPVRPGEGVTYGVPWGNPMGPMSDPFQDLEILCPRCHGPHQARAFDLGFRADWIVECGTVRVRAVSPPPREGQVPPELTSIVRVDLERLLADEPAAAPAV